MRTLSPPLRPGSGFIVVPRPTAEIGLAVVGPLVEGSAGTFCRALVVGPQGLDLVMVCVFFSENDEFCAQHFWQRVASLRREAQGQPLAVTHQRSTDSWRGLSEEFSVGLGAVLSALHSDFASVLVNRPHMSMAVCGRLLKRAGEAGPTALRFALQAVATEPEGLLYFCASSLPGAQAVLDSIFCGQSLPAAVARLGIKRSLLRRAQKSRLDFIFDNPRRDASVWVEQMRTISCAIPESAWDAPEFPQIWRRLQDLSVKPEEEIGLKIIRHCCRQGYGIPSFEVLLKRAETLEEQMGGEFGLVDAFAMVLAARISGPSVLEMLLTSTEKNALMERLLREQPCDDFVFDQHCVDALSSLQKLRAHGHAQRICVFDADHLSHYLLTKGAALYAVRSRRGRTTVGTIAVRYLVGLERVALEEVRGFANATPDASLMLAARAFVDACNQPLVLRRFARFESARARLLAVACRRYIGV